VTRALLVRHGQSVSNADPAAASLPAEVGDRLTELGRRQAAALTEALVGQGATRLLTSPMRRARETAAVINETLGLPLAELPYVHELRESDDYQRISPEEQKLRRWSVRMAEHPDDPDHAPGGAESFNDVLGRVTRLKRELERLGSEGERPLVITHGLFLRFFLAHSLLGDEFAPRHTPLLWQMRTLNCSISLFEQGERWHPVDPEIRDWSCITWMARPWEPPPEPGAGAGGRGSRRER
jgi:probable phosphoglycerate mutase